MEKSRGKGMTPLMQQYEDIKAKYPGTLLLFQVGDFYETFGEDAQQLHQITDIKLTKRSNGSAAAVPLAGFPLHALDAYLPKLIGAGLRVAVCDQTSPPKKGKTLVDRKVRELVTPGLTYNDHLLDKGKNNYLASLHFTKNKIGIAFLDISTGEFLIAEGDESAIIKLVEGFKPAEIIYNKEKKNALQHLLGDDHHCHPLEEWVYNFTYGHKRLNEHFGTTTLKGFGIAGLKAGIVAAGAVLRYLEQAEQLHLHHIIHLGRVEQERYMWLDKFTIRNLELLQPQHEEGVSLIHILDATVTPMGARKLKKWLLLPLKDFYLIEKRLAAVDLFYQDQEMAGALLEMLKEVGDLERLISKVASKRIKPRELAALAKALVQIKHICALLSHHPSPILQDFLAQLHPCDYIVTKIQTTLQEHLPIVFNRGGLIKKGVCKPLDELRTIAFEGSVYLQRIQAEERKKTGISSLKVAYNKVFGYYLEVTHAHRDKVPADWVRKQTLTNAERYITAELKHYEERILHAQERIGVLEYQLYQELVQDVAHAVPQIQQNAKMIGYIDCYQSFAHIAHKYGYTRPVLHNGHAIEITEGRHPVIERCLPPGHTYVSNDVLLNEQQQILLVTGPNMAGKSALLRQVALIVIMAHIGSFVPAKKAVISISDKIFVQMVPPDNIGRGESTFMREMTQMASFLNNLGPKSLVVVDELGRGTGTSDGLALAQSIIEYLHDHPRFRVKTLFSTHYHQLNKLADHLPRLKNFKVIVKEMGDRILFLHELRPGGSQHSFGIQVAKMAGVPTSVIDYAQQLIKKIEEREAGKEVALSPMPKPKPVPSQPSSLEAKRSRRLIEQLKKLEPNAMTPMEALMKLEELKRLLS